MIERAHPPQEDDGPVRATEPLTLREERALHELDPDGEFAAAVNG
jgi:hypothetical protein